MRRARLQLGTIVEITANDIEDIGPIEAAFAAIDRVQRLMSFHDHESDLSRINRAGVDEAIAIDPETYGVLAFANTLSKRSLGAFDITIASILMDHDFLPRSNGAVETAVTYRDLHLMPDHRICWQRKGQIDLGGIAKGYAVDRAIAALQIHGVKNGMVNAGGDLRCFGEAWPITLRHPYEPGVLMSVGWLSDGAVATSAGYFAGKQVGEGKIDPLVDPKTGLCTRWDGSFSVAASTCMAADALTKIIRLKPERAQFILKQFDAQAIVFDKFGPHTCGRSWFREDYVA
ncbi:FAD:protein FMN transferase [Beijerinckia indica]|uniref:FAD:protein FMN transferase n=1 Tax=Beijerinckia indica subsp. indica (strain ATCC 9039 / DSM 1715 / NCIMB 8712) TaxID=395963 RepID=B2IEQ0_BEII9|nr:FAD:protein FMN transferase [Beijerinckia indica]ACB96990.1 ApbE family lipoprotein [Beijerinckia indica subsp. indica ATCC 9039]